MAKQVLNATLAMDDEVIRMVWNMAKVAATKDNISEFVFSLNNTDDLDMIRATLGGDVLSELAFSCIAVRLTSFLRFPSAESPHPEASCGCPPCHDLSP